MKIEQIYTNCLAQGAYYIESNGEVAIIDPLRETHGYIDMANKNGSKIKYIFETHFHADFVSGHVDLASKTGATIVFGPHANPEYDIHQAKDGEIFSLGLLSIEVLHTPGHTMESTCYLLRDESNQPRALFSGDTLFIGDVGRPDLAVKSDLSASDLASLLYDSLHNKILPLPDDIIIYPAHGAGSACGKNLSKETFATLGNQRQFNYALQPMSRESFIQKVSEGQGIAPQYFPENVKLNKEGYNSLDEILSKALTPLTVDFFEREMKKSILVLDTRDPQDFAKKHIPGSINIGLNGSFAPWVGELIINTNRPILLVCQEGKESENIIRLSRVGYDHVIGYLSGGMEAWESQNKTTASIESISAIHFEELTKKEAQIQVLDVRNSGEYASEHLLLGQSKPLARIYDWMNELNTESTYYIHCAGGYRSMIAASILKASGFQVKDIAGGYKNLKETTIEKTAYVCPSTL